MDAISSGKKIFRTRIIRHSLNPTYRPRRSYCSTSANESAFKAKLDETSCRQTTTWATPALSCLSSSPTHCRLIPSPGCTTTMGTASTSTKQVPAAIVDGEGDAVGGNSRSGDYVQVCPSRCHVPCYILMRTRRTKYRPYDALRQFWRQYLKQW